MNKYLIFRTDRIGDFLISAILIKSIKFNDPKSHITVIASEKNYSYIKSFKYINKVILLKNNFAQKIKLLLKLNRAGNFKSIIIHDDKKRSKIISFFLNSKKKIYIDKFKNLSHINIIIEILRKLDYNFNKISLNTIERDQHIKRENNILLHFDEKWIFKNYIKTYKNIEPGKKELISFIHSIIEKTNKNLIITTGILIPSILIDLKSEINNDKVKFRYNLSFLELEQEIRKASILISCHGAISHIAAAIQIKQIDIIDKTYDYSKWNEHFRNYNFLYRKNFQELSHQILDKL